MSQQKPRRIGMGMKPRSPEESGSMNENPEVLPTTEGQETVSLQGPNEVADVAVGGGGLESVVAELFPAAAESESEVETGEPEVKTGEVSDVASNAVSDPLDDLLKLSFPEQMRDAEKIPAVLEFNLRPDTIPEPTAEEIELDRLADKMLPETEPVGFQVFTKNGTPLTGIISQEELKQFIQPPMLVVDRIDLSEFAKLDDIRPGTVISYEPPQPNLMDPANRYFIGTDFGSGPDKTVVAVIEKGTSEAPDKLVGIFDIELGEMDSGEYRHTVRIAEAYVEGAKQQAAADNQNLEDWLSGQLNFFLEQWFFSSGQK